MSLPEIATVDKPGQARLGLDQQPLFDLGMREIRAYARGLWTDHNIHDPGITALEILCYALTDLCSRACYPVEDLLAAATNDRRNMEGQFYTAREALPNAPLTELDYRKLLMDVDGVRNAWVRRVDPPPTCFADSIHGKLLPELPADPDARAGIREVRLRGLYEASIELEADVADADQDAVVAAARARLQANRNLCEDFVDPERVDEEPFLLCGEIEIEPGADADDVYVKVLLAVQQHLAPGVPRYSYDEMMRRQRPDGSPRTLPDLFEGPELHRGFIDDGELAAADLRKTIRLSDVISLIMDIEGVRAVRDLVLRPAKKDLAEKRKDESKWEVTVEDRCRCTLDAESSRLVLYKGRTPLQRGAGVIDEYDRRRNEAEKKLGTRAMGDPGIPLGRFRDAAVYESVQKHFPAVYGIAGGKLPPEAGDERRSRALQLEGYLLFFDQWLANAFAQLGEVRQLFSRRPDLETTYFSQRVPDLDEPDVEAPPAGTPPQALVAALKERDRFADHLNLLYRADAGNVELEKPADALRRRNRFLDHLVARLAERISDDLQVQAALFGAPPDALARAKCAFLSDYPRLGRDRALAFDYTRDPASGPAAANVSGLERRLAHLIGLGTITMEVYPENDTDAVPEYRWRVRRRFAEGVLISGTRHYPTPEAAAQVMMEAVASAELPARYRPRTAANGKFYFNIVDASGAIIERRIQYFATAALRDAAIAELVAIVAEHHGERLCAIENILLRPRPGADGTFLRICPDPGCGEGCPGDDPYSYRLHVVLPGRARRFDNMEFRRFAEELIREEVPAHLLPKICWVDDDRMNEIETAWRAWQAVLAGTDAEEPDVKLAALIEALFEAKNVYPESESRLGDCSKPEKFILGLNALGTVEDPPTA